MRDSIYRPYGIADITSLRDYRYIVPTGLPIYRPYGTSGISSLRDSVIILFVFYYRHVVPTGLTLGDFVIILLPIYRPYGTLIDEVLFYVPI
jgi:hypothetical protein